MRTRGDSSRGPPDLVAQAFIWQEAPPVLLFMDGALRYETDGRALGAIDALLCDPRANLGPLDAMCLNGC